MPITYGTQTVLANAFRLMRADPDPEHEIIQAFRAMDPDPEPDPYLEFSMIIEQALMGNYNEPTLLLEQLEREHRVLDHHAREQRVRARVIEFLISWHNGQISHELFVYIRSYGGTSILDDDVHDVLDDYYDKYEEETVAFDSLDPVEADNAVIAFMHNHAYEMLNDPRLIRVLEVTYNRLCLE